MNQKGVLADKESVVLRSHRGRLCKGLQRKLHATNTLREVEWSIFWSSTFGYDLVKLRGHHFELHKCRQGKKGKPNENRETIRGERTKKKGEDTDNHDTNIPYTF